jgi:hypothetical protein
LNLSFWRCLSQKRIHFCENFLGNENFRETKFREISWKYAHFRIIFAFRENGKNRFRFNPTRALHMLPAFYMYIVSLSLDATVLLRKEYF